SDGHVEPAGQGVDGRGADPVQSTGGLVAGAAEPAASVQLGQHQLDAGEPGPGVDVGRDAPAVVVDLDRAVGVQGDLDPGRVSGDSLVGGVVDDLVEEVTYATAVGRPDVHAGPLPDRVQTLQVGQVVGAVQHV